MTQNINQKYIYKKNKHKHQNQKKKWVILTDLGKASRTISRLFKDTKLKSALKLLIL
jgi:hypothetical protein